MVFLHQTPITTERLGFQKAPLGSVLAKARLLVLFFLLVFFSGLTSGFFQFSVHASETNLQKSAWPHDKSDLAPDPSLVFGRLDNGVQYVLLKNNEPKDRVSMYINFQVGSIYEEDHEQGMAHFLEHMLFNGTTHFPPGELVKYLQSIGMQFGNDVNARTGFFDTTYDLLLPTGNEQQLEKAFLVFSDYAQNALLLPEEIEKERKVVLAEMLSRDSAPYRTFVSSVKFELPGTRMIDRMPIGKKDALEAMDQSAMKAFYDRWYRPDNLILVMVGDFEPDIAVKLVKKHFNGMVPRRPKGSDPVFGDFAHNGIKSFYHYEKEEGNTTIAIEVARKVKHFKDSFDFERRRQIIKMAESMVQYRLDDMLRDPNTPFTEARIRSDYFYDKVFFAEISADCNPENWQPTLFRIEQTLRQALAFGFTQSELDRVKKEKMADLENQVKNMTTRDSRRLARHLLGSLGNNRVFQSPVQRLALYGPVISKTTLEDVHGAIKSTWSDDHRLVLVTGNADLSPSKDTSPEALISDTYGKSTGVKVTPVKEIAVRSFPYLPKSNRKSEIVKRTHLPETETLHIDFKNNIRLNLKKTDFKANEVLISAAFGLGRSSEPKNLPGLSIVTEDVINQSGLGQMSLDELDRAMAGKKTKIKFRSDDEHFAFDIITTPDEIDIALELLKAHILDPAFTEDALKLVQNRFQEQYDMLFHSVEGAPELYANRFLAGGDTRFGFPGIAHINKIHLSDINAWIAPSLASSPLEVSIVGNFDIDHVVKNVSDCLGTLPDRDATDSITADKQLVFPSGKTKEAAVDTKLPKALIIVAYPTDDVWKIHQTRVLSVLAEIFSEKVRLQIRENLGVAYSPHVFNQPSRAYDGYGKMQAFIQTDPDSVSLVIEEIKKIAQHLAQNGITEEDVKHALDPMLTGMKDMKRKNGYWLKTVLTGSKRYPQQLEWSRTIIDDYASISKEELSDAAKKFLNNDKAAVFIAKPN